MTGPTGAAHAFWRQRWTDGQIGFHEAKPNEQLVATFDRLALASPSRILVPLAGKAVDLRWLAARGHAVVGVEFVFDAIQAFFAELGLDASDHREAVGRHDAFTVAGVTLVHADMLEVDPADVGRFDAVYDRAALVALDPEVRARYVEVCAALSKPRGRTLLISFAHDANVDGPPWSLPEDVVRALFQPRVVTLLDRRHGGVSPRLAAAGVRALEESAYLIE